MGAKINTEDLKQEFDLTKQILYSDNKAYFFIPFSCSLADDELFNQACFKKYISSLSNSDLWIRKKLQITYLQKYITSKIDISLHERKPSVVSDEESMPLLFEAIKQNRGYVIDDDKSELKFDETQCFHFVLNIKEFEKNSNISFFENHKVFAIKNQISNRIADFMFTGAELFCFNSLVNILAIQLEFDTNVPISISNAEFILKKVDQDNIIIHPEEYLENENAEKISMLNIFEKTVKITNDLDYDFFFYANQNNARANVLTLLEVPQKDDYEKDLFYLKKCYSDGYFFTTTSEDESEIYSTSKDVIWGLSTEAAICLICPEMGRSDFLKNSFYRNFQTEYLFMYIFLLHQKYVLYKLLTDINVRSSKNIESLEKYKDHLYKFETDFVYSLITEVPQYQNVYDRLNKVFSLKEMFEDVHEPLISLSEVRYKINEDNREKQDKKINVIIFILSLLSVFSAWVDSYDFFKSFLAEHFHLSNNWIKPIQLAIIISILALVIFLFYKFFHSPKEKINND